MRRRRILHLAAAALMVLALGIACTQRDAAPSNQTPSAGADPAPGADADGGAAPEPGSPEPSTPPGQGGPPGGSATDQPEPAQGEGSGQGEGTEEPQGDAARILEPVAGAEISGDTVHVVGQARVFEAVLHGEIEDGHDILGRTRIEASAGAPEWGDFAVDIKLEKLPTNRTLHLILFMHSPKDGARIELASVPLKYTGPCADNRC